jgi:Flp pilus assembly protein protease CpaA
MARGAGWHQQLRIDFSLYLKVTASLLPTAILLMRRRRSRMMMAPAVEKLW